MNNYIEENKKKNEEISKYKENLDNEYKKKIEELNNNKNINNNEVQEKIITSRTGSNNKGKINQ